MHYKAIIFDMDGTIIDTSPLWSKVTRLLIERKGITVTPEIQAIVEAHLHGLGMNKACAFIKEFLGLSDTVECLVTEKTALARSLYERGITFISGFEQFHASLKSIFKTGIATNADDVTLGLSIKALKLTNFFGEHIYNISCVNNLCKPHPAIYLYVAEKLDVNPQECIAIEDSAHGIAAAQGAGMFCVGIYTSGDYGQIKNADMIINKYDDTVLRNLLKLSTNRK